MTDYFECKRHFKPSDTLIEIGIDGDKSGPTKDQIDFFRQIEDNYARISHSIVSVIEDEFSNWQEGFKISDFQKEFWPVYLKLPRCDRNPVSWEIAFESGHDLNHMFTLSMENFDAKEILIDG